MRAIQANPDDAARPDMGGRLRLSAPSPAAAHSGGLGRLAQTQGAYYVLFGTWPLLAPRSFQAVTGPKHELWLAETVGLLLVVAGAALFLAGRARRITREMALLGAGLAATLGTISVWCVLEPHTTRAYWLDAALQLVLLGAWVFLLGRRQRAEDQR